MSELAILCALLTIVLSDAFISDNDQYILHRIISVLLLISLSTVIQKPLNICLSLMLLYGALYDIFADGMKFLTIIDMISKYTGLSISVTAKLYFFVKVICCITSVFLVYSAV